MDKIQNLGFGLRHSKSDLNVYHSNESCTALFSKLRQQSGDLHAHSSSFRDVRLRQADK